MAYSEDKSSLKKFLCKKNAQNSNRILNYRTLERKCNSQSLYTWYKSNY
jgi:hypothetical protein